VTPDTCVAPALLRKYNLDQYIVPIYDDWQDYRDSQRDKWKDGSQLKRAESFYRQCGCPSCIKRLAWNKKIRRMEKIRRIRKQKVMINV
jgi:hypothetical protein